MVKPGIPRVLGWAGPVLGIHNEHRLRPQEKTQCGQVFIFSSDPWWNPASRGYCSKHAKGAKRRIRGSAARIASTRNGSNSSIWQGPSTSFCEVPRYAKLRKSSGVHDRGTGRKLVCPVRATCDISQVPEVLAQRQQIRLHNCGHIGTPVHLRKKQSESRPITILLMTTHEWWIHLDHSCRQLQQGPLNPVFPSSTPRPCCSVSDALLIGEDKSCTMRGQRSKLQPVKSRPTVPGIDIDIKESQITNCRVILITTGTPSFRILCIGS